MDNLIVNPDTLAANEETSMPETEREKKLKAQLSLMSQYRGEVSSKNNIRLLPDLKRGEIFWVGMERAPFVVAAIDTDKKGHTRVVIKKLDETATISTGLTVFDMNKSIIGKEPLFNWEDKDLVESTRKRLCDWFNEDGDSFYLLYGRDIHYVTLFNSFTTHPKDNFLFELKGFLSEVGDIISLDFDNLEGDRHCVEIWVRTAGSPAELLYLMPYDSGVVDI